MLLKVLRERICQLIMLYRCMAPSSVFMSWLQNICMLCNENPFVSNEEEDFYCFPHIYRLSSSSSSSSSSQYQITVYRQLLHAFAQISKNLHFHSFGVHYPLLCFKFDKGDGHATKDNQQFVSIIEVGPKIEMPVTSNMTFCKTIKSNKIDVP